MERVVFALEQLQCFDSDAEVLADRSSKPWPGREPSCRGALSDTQSKVPWAHGNDSLGGDWPIPCRPDRGSGLKRSADVM